MNKIQIRNITIKLSVFSNGITLHIENNKDYKTDLLELMTLVILQDTNQFCFCQTNFKKS
jgi:hypothetical protein